MNTILTPQEFKKMPGIRKPGTHVSEDNLQAYISEVEMLYIKPLVGDELYITLATDTAGKYGGRCREYPLRLPVERGGIFLAYLVEGAFGAVQQHPSSGLRLPVGVPDVHERGFGVAL